MKEFKRTNHSPRSHLFSQRELTDELLQVCIGNLLKMQEWNLIGAALCLITSLPVGTPPTGRNDRPRKKNRKRPTRWACWDRHLFGEKSSFRAWRALPGPARAGLQQKTHLPVEDVPKSGFGQVCNKRWKMCTVSQIRWAVVDLSGIA